MSKTSQENKKKKLVVEDQVIDHKASESVEETGVNPEIVNEETVSAEGGSASGGKRTAKVRGKKYQTAKKKVDVAKFYPIKDAAKLVKETSFSKFEGKIEAHITVTEEGNLGEIVFPHLETASKKIVILNDAILAEIKDGKVDFDILIATPATMPKLLPFAKVLGPKGLMPNPKSGTLTDKPEEAVKKLSVAKTMIKTEKKAPVVHIIVGKVSQPVEELSANVAELIKVVKPIRIKKLALCATMGPSVKVEVLK
ncbi:hypothetical protein KBC75_01315 [Candidatus Shapirobacteria bacterium]|nr:hypothetical protein [Candidatus Shapirobacteria bacterium]